MPLHLEDYRNASCATTGSPRYRLLVLGAGTGSDRSTEQLEAAVAAVDELTTTSMREPSRQAVRDAALATRGHVHAVAYDVLTRAVRQALGPIHPGDGPLHR